MGNIKMDETPAERFNSDGLFYFILFFSIFCIFLFHLD